MMRRAYINGVKITLTMDDEPVASGDRFVRLSMYRRGMVRPATFYTTASTLNELRKVPTLHEVDGCSRCDFMARGGGMIKIRLLDIHYAGNHALSGNMVCGEIPAMDLALFLRLAGTPSRVCVKWLYVEDRKAARVDLSHASAAIIATKADKKKRRALSKALRNCFRWPGETVTLYSDGGADFFFRTASGYPSCGGLICHELHDKEGRVRYRYEVHT